MRPRGNSGILRNRRLTRGWTRTVDVRDVGVRPEVGRALGFVDDAAVEGSSEHAVEACMTFGCPICIGGGR
jgi:hypothetical protein